MNIFPIIPIWLMTIICSILIIITLKNNKKNINQILIILLLFIINLRIMIKTDYYLAEEKNIEILFVIDNTISMNAEDYNGREKRLDGVKQDCKYIIENFTGAKFSIITFSNSAKILIPYTRDSNLAIESIEIIEPIQELYARGSSLNTPIETIESTLKRTTEKNTNNKRILFFISDGEITDDSKLESFEKLKKYVDDGAILGYGTTQGGNMLETNKYTNKTEYIMDYSGLNYGKAVSKIDEKNLQKIASDIGVNYIHMDSQDKITSTIKRINKMTASSTETVDKANYDDIYYIFVFPLLILITIELKKYRRNLQ